MKYDLPRSVEVNGTKYKIRADYRDILTILEALSDVELSLPEKAQVMLEIFYPAFEEMPTADYEEALRQAAIFINCGREEDNRNPVKKFMDWQQDFLLIVAPINRVLGTDVRGKKYLHWFTFCSAYQEIGDCTFAQVVAIRNKKLEGKKLEKSEQEFYRRNRDIIDFKQQYTAEEEAAISQWI